MEVTIQQIHQHNSQINSFELMSCNGESLPSFKAGVHIDVHMSEGLIRQYIHWRIAAVSSTDM